MEKEENVIVKEKSKLKTFIINLAIIISIIMASMYIYSRYIGTKKIVIKEYKIASNKIPKEFSGNKIVYFSDLLYGSSVFSEDLDYIKSKINILKPDIVIFGGDLILKGFNLNDADKQKLTKFLEAIDSKLGKYGVLGSYDNEETIKLLESGNFILLDNKNEYIYNGETPICLTFIGSYNNGDYKLDEALTCENHYNIVISHEADITDNILAKKSVDLILAGNTVGGEIRIPYYGGIFNFEGSKKYNDDYYELGETKLFVSNGLGTKKVYKRFFNRPSISLFRLKSL